MAVSYFRVHIHRPAGDGLLADVPGSIVLPQGDALTKNQCLCSYLYCVIR